LREEEIYFDTGGGDCEGMRQSGLRVCKDGVHTYQRTGDRERVDTFIYTKARGWCRDTLSAVSAKLLLVKLPSR